MDDSSPFESLDWVLEELYEDRWSERKEVGVREGFGVSGVRGLVFAEGETE